MGRSSRHARNSVLSYPPSIQIRKRAGLELRPLEGDATQLYQENSVKLPKYWDMRPARPVWCADFHLLRRKARKGRGRHRCLFAGRKSVSLATRLRVAKTCRWARANWCSSWTINPPSERSRVPVWNAAAIARSRPMTAWRRCRRESLCQS